MLEIKRKNKRTMFFITAVVVMVCVALSFQIVKLYQKNKLYIAREESLKSQLENEEKRREDLEKYEQYINSQDYVEDMAKTKLGLVYDDEIIFREK
ncbi:MAG: septum formation initiator family protein [Lachnospiraceae bacterium]|nr:septum formation initiator family protein [Lachnospiraceae bacterium]